MNLWILLLSFAMVTACAGCGDDDDVGDDDDDDATDGGDDDDADDDDADDDDADDDDDDSTPTGTFCAEECTEDVDCKINGGNEGGLVCRDRRCNVPACEETADCTARYSGWTEDCDYNSDCVGMALPGTDQRSPLCFDTNGAETAGGGKCATAPIPGTFECSAIGFVELDGVDIEGGDVIVCANTRYTCEDGDCVTETDPVRGCEDDDDCMTAAHPRCNVETGLCECVTDPEDSCADDGDVWREMAGGNVCQESGQCGCDSVEDCAGDPVFDGTTEVCE